jgi:hypothetical protein
MTEIIISCAADPDLAESLNKYLLSSLYSIDKNGITLKDDEIYVEYDGTLAARKTVIDAIHSFIETKEEYKNHQITEFDNLITVGIGSKPGQLMENMLTCEMCNYMTPYQEQLYLHRMTHGNVMIG